MARLIWTEPALSDLNDIDEYIAPVNISASQKLVKALCAAVERLRQSILCETSVSSASLCGEQSVGARYT
jgi:plasmid stabilization system protein ParE